MKAIHMLVAVFSLSLGGFAAHAFEADFEATPPQFISVGEIVRGEALVAKVDTYGEAEVARLEEVLRGDLERELGGRGRLAGDAGAGAVLNVVIEDVKPNRPTAKQLGEPPRPPDIRSVSIGGARVSASLVDADGNVLARFKYAWQTPDIRHSQHATTWTDTRRAFDRFAGRVARAISSQGAAG